MDFEVTYPKKVDENVVISKTPAAKLVSERRAFGSLNSSLNKLIHGDNLTALKALAQDPSVKGSVQLIYIDPPYATEKDYSGKAIWYQESGGLNPELHAYSDRHSGAEYLEFLRQRLILMRELLSDDGTIYVHLNDNMAFAVKIIMDEVFGERQFRNWITRRKCSSKNYTRKQFGNITDYIMCYAASAKDPVWNRPYRRWNEKHAAKEYPRFEKETGRRFKQVPIYAPGERNGSTGKPWRGMMPPEGKHWFTSPENLEKLDEEGKIYWSPNGNPRKKVYLDESDGVPYTDLWMNFRDAHNQNVSVTGYPHEKNQDMLEVIVEASSNEGDLVLDAFSGSGTTLVAAYRLNRRWIGIDSSELAVKVAERRLKEVLEGGSPSLFDEKKPGFEVIEAQEVTAQVASLS